MNQPDVDEVQEAMKYISNWDEISKELVCEAPHTLKKTVKNAKIVCSYVLDLEAVIERQKLGTVLLSRVEDCFDDLKNKKIDELTAECNRLKAEIEILKTDLCIRDTYLDDRDAEIATLKAELADGKGEKG